MEAVAALIRLRRDQLGMSRRALAGAAGVTEMSVYRIEEKGQEPGASTIARLLDALQLPWEVAKDLLLDPKATAADGVHAVEIASLKTEEDRTVDEIVAYVLSLPADRRPAAMRVLRALADSEEYVKHS